MIMHAHTERAIDTISGTPRHPSPEVTLARPEDFGAIAALNVAAYAEFRAVCGEEAWEEMMGAARGLYARLGFVEDGVLPPRHGQPCWRYRLDLASPVSGRGR